MVYEEFCKIVGEQIYKQYARSAMQKAKYAYKIIILNN